MNNLPEKWYMKITIKNLSSINHWRESIDSTRGDLKLHDYTNIEQDGWGTMSTRGREITFDQFKKFVLKEKDLSKLPESWCVLNDGSQSFMSTVIPYLNNIKKNKHILYDGAHHGGYYGINHPKQDGEDWSSSKPWGTVLTIDQFIKLTTQNMKTEITHLPIIKGEPRFLTMFMQDCEKLGYKISEYCNYEVSTLKLNTNTDCIDEDGFKILTRPHDNCVYHGLCKLGSITFNLPNEWTIALEFMKENMEIWKQINEKSKFKAGDWVLVRGGIGNGLSAGEDRIVQLFLSNADAAGNLEGTFMFKSPHTKSWLRTLDSSIVRFATPEEIAQTQVKIFKMTSSSGDFELEVSEKGIYYRPEDNWLSTTFNWKSYSTAEIGGVLTSKNKSTNYNVKLEKITVGCKDNTNIYQWIEVYDYYNSIKK